MTKSSSNNRPYLRHQRVSKLIEDELAKIILKEVEFEPGVLATLTEVMVSKKLDEAKVYISVIPSQKSAPALELLNKRSPFLGHLLLKTLNIYPLPHLEFVEDKGADNASLVEKASLKIKELDGK